MRINIKLSKNTEILPYDIQYKLVGRLHSWLGENEFHGGVSLYSFSGISGNCVIKNGLDFPDGGQWFISTWDREMGKKIVISIMNNPEFIYGMNVNELIIQEDPDFGNEFKYYAASPILIRDYIEKGNAKFLTYNDTKSDEIMTQTLKRKLQIAGIDDDVSVEFDRAYTKSKTKLIDIKGIKNRANVCPIIIKGSPEALKFAWNVGAGHSTGAGFGALQ